MAANFAEFVVRDAALNWLELRGLAVLCLSAPQRIASRQPGGPDIADGEPGAERSNPNYRDVVLDGRLRQALFRLNPDLPSEALEDAYRKLMRISGKLRVADTHSFSSDTKRPTEGTRIE